MQFLRQQGSGAVFVDHGFHPFKAARIIADDRNATAARTDDANPGIDQHLDRGHSQNALRQG